MCCLWTWKQPEEGLAFAFLGVLHSWALFLQVCFFFLNSLWFVENSGRTRGAQGIGLSSRLPQLLSIRPQAWCVTHTGYSAKADLHPASLSPLFPLLMYCPYLCPPAAADINYPGRLKLIGEAWKGFWPRAPTFCPAKHHPTTCLSMSLGVSKAGHASLHVFHRCGPRATCLWSRDRAGL